MSQTPYQRKPGDLEIRIRPNGRVYIAQADEALLDVCEALDPDSPAVIERRKARSNHESRSAETDGAAPAASGGCR